jgi:hypothetical protein
MFLFVFLVRKPIQQESFFWDKAGRASFPIKSLEWKVVYIFWIKKV